MKLSFWDRVLMFLYVLIVLLLCLSVALRPFGLDVIGDLFDGLRAGAGNGAYYAIVGGLVLIMVLLSVFMLMMIFDNREKRRDRMFITVNSGDGGRVRIAMSALSQMVRQVVDQVEGVRDLKIRISGSEDAIVVQVDLSLENGVHVPTVTLNMQRTIRNHIEANCGVAVSAVEITVNSMAGAEEPEKRRYARKGHVAMPAHSLREGAEAPAPAPAEELTEEIPLEPAEPAFPPEEEAAPNEEEVPQDPPEEFLSEAELFGLEEEEEEESEEHPKN